MSVIYLNGTYKSSPNISLLKRQLEAKINKITSVDTSQFVTKEELNTKQDTIVDLDQIRLGSEKGKTALQSIPSEYITETELENKGYLTEQQINNLELIQSLTERITALEEAVLELQTPSGELDT